MIRPWHPSPRPPKIHPRHLPRRAFYTAPRTRPVLTAVAVALMLDLPEDSDGPPLEIHVLPAQAERFTLPKAERESYGPAGSVPSVLCHGQDVPSLIGAQRLYLDFFHSGSVDQRADVPGGSDEDRMATSLLINTAQVLVIRSRATGRNIGTVI